MGKNLNRYYRGRWVAGRLKGLGGFAASLKIELAMTMRATVMDRLSEGFGGSAGLRLLAGAVVLAMAMPADADGRNPTRIPAEDGDEWCRNTGAKCAFEGPGRKRIRVERKILRARARDRFRGRM